MFFNGKDQKDLKNLNKFNETESCELMETF